jgi:hypothetical protein
MNLKTLSVALPDFLLSGEIPLGDGELRLMRAVLHDALQSWQAGAMPGVVNCPVLRRHATADFWIFGKYDNYPRLSFTQVCQYLGFDPEFIRRKLIEWRDAAEAASAEASYSSMRVARVKRPVNKCLRY